MSGALPDFKKIYQSFRTTEEEEAVKNNAFNRGIAFTVVVVSMAFARSANLLRHLPSSSFFLRPSLHQFFSPPSCF